MQHFSSRSPVKLTAFLFLLFFSISHTGKAQFWTEDFNNGCAAGCDATAYVGPNGAWTQTILGPEGADANMWYVSCAENGHTPTVCGTGCAPASATATLATLHLGSNPNSLGDIGAAYDAGGLCGFWTCPQTNRRIESPVINCTGQSTITLAFNYIENGSNPNDDASVWYYDGSTWALLVNSAPTLVNCPNSQGRWTAFSTVLPASADNNPNVKIGFLWVNNDDGVGTDPSFAVDDITLSVSTPGPPVAAFTASATSVCIGDAVNFTDNSTGTPTSWSWTFPGGTPPSSVSQNVTGVTWAAAGTYTVTLTATNANGSNSTTQVITVNPAPNLIVTATPSTICVGQNSTLNASGASTYVWNPGNLPGASVIVSPPSTTTYTVTGTSAAGCTNTAQVTVIVQSCNVPQVAFVATDTSICVGDCIDFTDQSTNSPTSWSWTFSGASTGTSALQNPTNICYPAAGTFAVTLVATNANGNGTLTKTGYIVVNPPPPADAGNNATICTGQSTTLIGSGGTLYNWQPGNLTGSSVTVTPASTTTYTLTVTDANGCTATDLVTITVQACVSPVAALSISDNSICESTCIDFTDMSTGSPISWQWSFPGAVPSSSTQQNPANICYNTPGNYNVTLITTNAFGSDTVTMTNAVTVGAMPTVTASSYVTIAIGNSTQLTATAGAGTYSWSPPTGLNSSTAQNPVASPTVTTTYTVTYTNSFGCTVSDTVTVEVIEAYAIFVPSAFSPNGDVTNDVLFVRGAGIQELTFMVYDRFGEKVFESSNVNDGWDGTFRGKDMNSGIYVWYVSVVFFNGTTETLKGDVSLVR